MFTATSDIEKSSKWPLLLVSSYTSKLTLATVLPVQRLETDIPFKRAESNYGIEQVGVKCNFLRK